MGEIPRITSVSGAQVMMSPSFSTPTANICPAVILQRERLRHHVHICSRSRAAALGWESSSRMPYSKQRTLRRVVFRACGKQGLENPLSLPYVDGSQLVTYVGSGAQFCPRLASLATPYTSRAFILQRVNSCVSSRSHELAEVPVKLTSARVVR